MLEIVEKLQKSSEALEERNNQLIKNLGGINNSIEEIAVGSSNQSQDTQQIYRNKISALQSIDNACFRTRPRAKSVKQSK